MGAHTDGATNAMGWAALNDCLAVLRGDEPPGTGLSEKKENGENLMSKENTVSRIKELGLLAVLRGAFGSVNGEDGGGVGCGRRDGD